MKGGKTLRTRQTNCKPTFCFPRIYNLMPVQEIKLPYKYKNTQCWSSKLHPEQTCFFTDAESSVAPVWAQKLRLNSVRYQQFAIYASSHCRSLFGYIWSFELNLAMTSSLANKHWLCSRELAFPRMLDTLPLSHKTLIQQTMLLIPKTTNHFAFTAMIWNYKLIRA
jgi:hypothetical protein